MAEVLVGRRQDLVDGNRILINLQDSEVCILNYESHIVAYENRCRHQGGPVGEGVVIPKVECMLDDSNRNLGEQFSDSTIHLVCPWHGWEYDFHTGRSVTEPGVHLRQYPVRLSGDDIYVELPDEDD